jgi:1-acyl-sn-glycerol-3-phosphate acyltransferase/nucleoside-diphosphate-sugar epimerase
MTHRLTFVATIEPGAQELFEHLRREWLRLWPEQHSEQLESGVCTLWTGSAADLAARLQRAATDDAEHNRTVLYGAAWRRADPRIASDLEDARAVLEGAANSGCRLIVLSSTEVYLPDHHHPGFVTEDQVRGHLHGNRHGNRWCAGWAALETLATDIAAGTGAPLVILRAAPAPVVGGRDFWSRLLSRPLVPTVPGYDPSIQLLAIEELARAVVLAATSSTATACATNIFNVAPSNTVPIHRAVRLAGSRRVALPRWLQRLARRGLGFTGWFAAAERIDLLRYPWAASGERAQAELGFVAAISSAEVAARMRGGARDLSVAKGVDASWEWGRDGLDRHGMDRGYIHHYGRLLFRWVHDFYWRIEVRGLEHVPRNGPGVLAGVHRGFMPYDGVMALHLLVRECGRYPRFLTHPTLLKFPFLANFMTKLGGIPANQENADWVLERGGLLGIFPEGIRGAFRLYRDAYRIGKMGREYVKTALRHQVPIIPFVTVGSAEIFPILARIDWGWWKRFSEWPCFPIAPPFPLLPWPLPSKWHTRFLEPIDVAREYGPEAAHDPAVVQAINNEVRRRLEEAMGAMRSCRRSIFFGSVFDDEPLEALIRQKRDQ